MIVNEKRKLHFFRILSIMLVCCMLVACFPTNFMAAGTEGAVGTQKAAGTGLKVGASNKDITPTDDMLPIHAGNARIGLRLVGVIEGLNVRVIALQNNDDPITLIVNVEAGKGPYPPDFIKFISEATGVAEENIFWSATHVHSAPEITGATWETQMDAFNVTTGKNEGRFENLRKWGYLVKDQLIAAAQEAIDNMVQAEVGIGYTESYINVNRVTKYVDSATGAVSYAEGFNGAGPSDKTLTTIKFQSRDTKEPIAFIVHYAMHLTTMYGNQYFLPEYASVNGFTEEELRRDDTLLADGDIANNSGGIHPDIGGMVSRYLENENEGAVALWMSGAAGDQNPIFRNNMIFANPETGLKTEYNIPGADINAVNYYASIQFVDAKRALASITEFEPDVPITHAWGGTQIPNKTEGGAPYNLYQSVMRMGDITMAGFAGELYNGIGVAMKEGSISKHTLVVNHSWTHAIEVTGYHPDDLTLETGSDRSTVYMPGTINSAMTQLMNDLIIKAEPKWSYAEDGTASNLETGEIVIVGLDGIAGTDDDNRVVNPAGKTLVQNAQVKFDGQGNPYVELGNGFKLYGGADGKIGTGDDSIIDFGTYPQSDATGALKDPVSWRLLDIKDNGATAVLIASQALDATYFNLADNKDKNDWETSNLRSWLNSNGGKAVRNTFSSEADPGFYDTAFNAEEKAKINLTTVKMDYSNDTKWDPSIFVRPVGFATYNNTTGAYPAYDRVLFEQINASNPNNWTGNGNNPSNENSPWILTTTMGTNTQDYVYAISGEEYFEYFGDAWIEGDGWDLVNYANGYFQASAYAAARGAKTSPTENLPYKIVDSFTRSPGRTDLTADGIAYGVFWSGTGSMNVGRPVYGNPNVNNIATVSTYGIIPMINVSLTDEGNSGGESQWSYGGDGTATNLQTSEIVIVGLDGIAGTNDDNRVVNPAGKTLVQNAQVKFDGQGNPYVELGNGFKLYGGADGKIGTGDDSIIDFGTYPQSDATGALKDPVSWRLLDIKDNGATAVLIASQALDATYFNLADNKDKNDWETSNLRSWLNSSGGKAVRNTFSSEADSGFYDTAFNADEKAKINLTTVKMDYSNDKLWDSSLFVRPEGFATYNNTTGAYPAYDRVLFEQINASNPNNWTGNGNNPSNENSPWILTTTTGTNTQDYVYAISGEEYFEYFGDAWIEGDGWDLVNYANGYFQASAYASARGAKTSPTENLPYKIVDSFTRSPGRTDLTTDGIAYGVFWSGTGSMNVGRPVYGNPNVNNIATVSTYGIIPMINVGLTSSHYSVNATAGSGGTVSGSNIYDHGATVTLVATPYNNYSFNGWYENGTKIIGAGAVYSFTLTSDRTLEARFSYFGGGSSDGESTSNPTTPVNEGNTESDTTPSDDVVAPSLDKNSKIAYISGYTDGTVRPENNITRAEAAEIFYKLALDKGEGSFRQETAKFSDVGSDEWYSEAIGFLVSVKVLSGYEDGTFKPNQLISRAEFVAVASKFEELNLNGAPTFTDVSKENWAYNFIVSAYNHSWISGYPDETFRPNNKITRAEAIAIVNRMLGRDTSNVKNLTSPFTDLTDKKWYYNDVIIASGTQL